MKWVWIVAAALSAAPMAVNAATVVNGGFETGDFTGWTPIGAPDQFVVSSYTHPHTGSGTYFPVEGAKFALVGAYMFQSLTPEGISQDLDFNGSERLNGSAALLSFADSAQEIAPSEAWALGWTTEEPGTQRHSSASV